MSPSPEINVARIDLTLSFESASMAPHEMLALTKVRPDSLVGPHETTDGTHSPRPTSLFALHATAPDLEDSALLLSNLVTRAALGGGLTLLSETVDDCRLVIAMYGVVDAPAITWTSEVVEFLEDLRADCRIALYRQQ